MEIKNIEEGSMKYEEKTGMLKHIAFGAISGIVATVVFTVVHNIFIINIWFSFPMMAVAGLICGVFIAGSFGVMYKTFRTPAWLKYNFVFLLMFLLLALSSIIVFDPITTTAEVMAGNKSPGELINYALPLSGIFTVVATVVIGLIYAKCLFHYLFILATCLVLMLFLGLNVSIIGLVEIPIDSVYLIMELFGLIIVILVSYSLSFLVLIKRIYPIKSDVPN